MTQEQGEADYRVKGKYMVDSTSGRTAEDSMDMVVRHKGGVPILGQGDYIEMSNYTTPPWLN